MRKWSTDIVARNGSAIPHEILRTLLLEDAFNNTRTITSRCVSGYGDEDTARKILLEQQGHLLMSSEGNQQDTIEVYQWDHGYVSCHFYEDHFDITIDSVEPTWSAALYDHLKEIVSEIPPKGSVMMLAHEGSYYLVELGSIDAPLERGNYTDQTLRQYDLVIEDLQSRTPSGRLTLLDGAPGTGKSYLIRGIISQVNCLFVYVPASIAGTITGPDIIPIFLREKDKDVPIVLIMEDADSTITTRQLDNVSKLSDLLNMSDGLLGDMADVRILATTNAKRQEIDAAVLRTGRLNEHLQLGLLEQAHANEIFQRLLGNPHPSGLTAFMGKNSLAEVYKEARKHGWKPSPSSTKKRTRRCAPSLLDY